MPCRDYYDDHRVVDNTQTYKDLRDKLARIACKAMTELEKRGVKLDNECEEWFTQHKIADAAEAKRVAAEQKKVAEYKRILREQKRQEEISTLKKLQAKYRGVL